MLTGIRFVKYRGATAILTDLMDGPLSRALDMGADNALHARALDYNEKVRALAGCAWL